MTGNVDSMQGEFTHYIARATYLRPSRRMREVKERPWQPVKVGKG